jgi:hypothetical protein
MAELGAATGCTWRPTVDAVDFRVRTGATEHVLQGRRVYSYEGPPYLELVEMGGEVWGEGRPAGPVHLGYWVDDLAEADAHLASHGLERVVSDAGADGGFALFAYYRSVAGPLIEILPRWRRDQILNEAG